MLLLKKKKYAALTAEKRGDQIVTKEEFKGLDIVRRDWSNIARTTGEDILKILLHETEEDKAIENIHEHLELGLVKIKIFKIYSKLNSRNQIPSSDHAMSKIERGDKKWFYFL